MSKTQFFLNTTVTANLEEDYIRVEVIGTGNPGITNGTTYPGLVTGTSTAVVFYRKDGTRRTGAWPNHDSKFPIGAQITVTG
jgi:hypothetical protein